MIPILSLEQINRLEIFIIIGRLLNFELCNDIRLCESNVAQTVQCDCDRNEI